MRSLLTTLCFYGVIVTERRIFMFFLVKLVASIFRYPIAFAGTVMVTLSVWCMVRVINMNEIIVFPPQDNYNILRVQLLENYQFFAFLCYFGGLLLLATQLVMFSPRFCHKIGGGITAAIAWAMCFWIMIGPIVGHPFLGLIARPIF